MCSKAEPVLDSLLISTLNRFDPIIKRAQMRNKARGGKHQLVFTDRWIPGFFDQLVTGLYARRDQTASKSYNVERDV